jgi:hypothetical protein
MVGEIESNMTPPRGSESVPHRTFTWNFIVEEMAEAQIGLGLMLQWHEGLRWGLFGAIRAHVTFAFWERRSSHVRPIVTT